MIIMRRKSQIKMSALLAIVLVSAVVLTAIFWPRIQEGASYRFKVCSPCVDEVVKFEAINYKSAIGKDANVFDGVRIRLCNCMAEKADLTSARISYKVELPEGASPIATGSLPLPVKNGAPVIPSLEPQEGARFDWADMTITDKVPVGLAGSASGKVTLKLLVGGVETPDSPTYIWQLFYAPV